MSIEVEQTATIDVKDILQVTVDYGKLSLVLSTILRRLDDLERSYRERSTQPPANMLPVHEAPTVASEGDLGPRITALETATGNLSRICAEHVNQLDKQAQAIENTTVQVIKHEERLIELESRKPETDEVRKDLGLLSERIQLLENAAPISAPSVASGLVPVESAPVVQMVTQIEPLEDALPKEPAAQGADMTEAIADLKQRMDDLESKFHKPQKAVPTREHDALYPHGDIDGLRDQLNLMSDLPQRVAALEALNPKLDARDGSTDHLESLERQHNEMQAQAAAVLNQVRDLENQIGRLSTKVESCLTRSDLPPVTDLTDLQTSVADLQRSVSNFDQFRNSASNAIKDVQDSLEMLSKQITAVAVPVTDGASGGISDGQFNLLKGIVDGLNANQKSLRNDLNEGLKSLRASLEALEQTQREYASKSDLRELRDANAALQGQLDMGDKRTAEALAKLDQTKANRADLPRVPDAMPRESLEARFEEILRSIGAQEAKILDLTNKSSTIPFTVAAPNNNALLGKVADLEARLRALSESSDNALVREIDGRVAQFAAEAARDREWANQQVIEIRATIDHIHHTKADTAQVANKAERDYVENALEKLMREVEQVMNTTNAGLIDTLDKSLGILRDMIDGKASKADLARVRSTATDDVGVVPEGLTGYKSYRCLGCNRTVDAMRTRPMGANFSNFMNRLPSSPRQAPPRTADEVVRRPIGLIGNSPTSC